MRVLADRIAAAAQGNFLYARHVVDALIDDIETLGGLDEPAALQLPLPGGGLGGVYQDFLRRELGRDHRAWAERTRPVLAALAVAQDDGLDTDQLVQVTSQLANRPLSRDNVRDVTGAARPFLDGRAPDGPFRLYHQSFAEFLVDAENNPDFLIDRIGADEAIAVAYTSTGDWLAWDGYGQRNVATHAARTGRLDALLDDPRFLLAADPGRLLSALSIPSRDATVGIGRQLLHQVGSRLRGRSREERAAILELAARQLGAGALADVFAQLDLQRPWSVRWAHPHPAGTGRIVGWHENSVRAVAMGERHGRTIIVTGGHDGMVRVWDLRTGDPLLAWPHGEGKVEAVAVGELADGPVVVSAGADGTLRRWRLVDGSPSGGPLANPWSRIWSVAVGKLANRPIVVAGGDGKNGDWRRAVCLWDLETGQLLHVLEPDCQRQLSDELTIYAVAAGSHDHQPIVVAAHDRGAHMWTWTGATWASTTLIPERLPGYFGRVHPWAIALGLQNGRPIAICGGHPDWITTFDLESGERATPAFDAPDGDVIGVAAGELDGRTIAVSGNYFGNKGDPGVLRVWDLENEEQPLRGSLVGHYAGVPALAITRPDNRPILASGGMDNTVRVWDLAASLQRTPEHGEYHDVKWLLTCELEDRPVVVCKSILITPNLTISKSQVWHEESRYDPFQRTPHPAKPPPTSVIQVWDAANGEPTAATPQDLDRLGRLLAAGHVGDTALGVSINEPTRPAPWEHNGHDGQPAPATSPDDRAHLSVWDLSSGVHLGQPIPTRPLGALDYNLAVGRLGDQAIIAFCDDRGRVEVLDVRTGEPVWEEPLPTFGGGSVLRAFGAPSGRPIAVVTAPWKFGIWDLQQRELAEPLATPPSMQGEGWTTFPAAVGELAGRPVVVYSGYGRPIRVWDITTQRECQRAIWVDTKITALAIAPDSIILASGPAGSMLALRVGALFFEPPRAEELGR